MNNKNKIEILLSEAGIGNAEINAPMSPQNIRQVEEESNRKQTILQHNRVRQELEDFRYNRLNTTLINRAYKSVVVCVFKPRKTCCNRPLWLILLCLMFLCYILGSIDKELIDNKCLLIIQSILRALSETLAAFFIVMLAVPSAQGIRRLFSRLTDKML